MRAIAIVGYKNSGKTDLAIKLADYLKRQNYIVGYLKFSAHGFDKSDSDSGKLSEVADKVAGLSEKLYFYILE